MWRGNSSLEESVTCNHRGWIGGALDALVHSAGGALDRCDHLLHLCRSLAAAGGGKPPTIRTPSIMFVLATCLYATTHAMQWTNQTRINIEIFMYRIQNTYFYNLFTY